MRLSERCLVAWCGLGAVALLACGIDVRPQSLEGFKPSLESVKQMEYVPQKDGRDAEAAGYAELWNIILACRAYSKGLSVLPEFHEPILTRGETGIAVFRKVSPSVVLVVMANFKDEKVAETGLGTGVILDSSGTVLTNWHVIHGFEAGIIFLKPTVGTEPPKDSAYGMRVVAENPQADLALLKIVKPPATLVPVRLGEMTSVQVAEDIHIIGHPHGQLWSYSTGVVSQIRDNYDWKYEDGSKHLAKVLQMQTAINPGNSGGPVLDNTGSMLGLVAMSEEGQNLDYAVAVDVIKEFVNRSTSSRPRGGDAHREAPKASFFSARTKDGLSVTKAVYPQLVSYTVRDGKGALTEAFAETSDGAVLRGSRPNAFGGLDDWSYQAPGGKTLVIKGGGDTPELITVGTGT